MAEVQTKASEADNWQRSMGPFPTNEDAAQWAGKFAKGWPNLWWRAVDRFGAPIDGTTYKPPKEKIMRPSRQARTQGEGDQKNQRS